MGLPSPILLLSLFLTVVFGITGLGIGINALQKSNDEKDFVRGNAPPGVRVEIDTSDVSRSGINITIISGVLALTSLFTLLYLALRPLPSSSSHRSNSPLNSTSKSSSPSRSSSPSPSPTHPAHTKHSTHTPLLTSALLHLFFSLWVLAALIAFVTFARNRSAQVTAFLIANGARLPDTLVAQQQASLGVTPVYWRKRYLRIVAILPWFVVLFGFITSALLFRAASRSKAAAARRRAGTDDERGVPVASEVKEVKAGEEEYTK